MKILIELDNEAAQEIMEGLSTSMLPAIRANTLIRTISQAIQTAIQEKAHHEEITGTDTAGDSNG